jgi:hypothetical protein
MSFEISAVNHVSGDILGLERLTAPSGGEGTEGTCTEQTPLMVLALRPRFTTLVNRSHAPVIE